MSWLGWAVGVLGLAVGIVVPVVVYRRQKRESANLAKDIVQGVATSLRRMGIEVTPQIYAGLSDTVGKNLWVHLAREAPPSSEIAATTYGFGSPGGKQQESGGGGAGPGNKNSTGGTRPR